MELNWIELNCYVNAAKNVTEDGSSGNLTAPLFYDAENDASGTSGTHPHGQQTLNLIEKAVVQMRQVIHWSVCNFHLVSTLLTLMAFNRFNTPLL